MYQLTHQVKKCLPNLTVIPPYQNVSLELFQCDHHRSVSKAKDPQPHRKIRSFQTIIFSFFGFLFSWQEEVFVGLPNTMTTAKKKKPITCYMHSVFPSRVRSHKHTLDLCQHDPSVQWSAFLQHPSWDCVIFGPRLIPVHRQETCKGRPTWWECI